MTHTQIWTCKIGETLDRQLPPGADAPMRAAVAAAYESLSGRPFDFLFSGWAGALTESERAVVENRLPDRAKTGYDAERCVAACVGIPTDKLRPGIVRELVDALNREDHLSDGSFNLLRELVSE